MVFVKNRNIDFISWFVDTYRITNSTASRNYPRLLSQQDYTFWHECCKSISGNALNFTSSIKQAKISI